MLRAQNPTLGITKLHTRLLSEHPAWVVSEKRARKFLQSGALALTSNGAKAVVQSNSGQLRPISRIIEGLDVSRWTKKVQVQYFDRHKGKGLVATERIAEGEVLWKEDPFILAPEWYVSPVRGHVFDN
jgi:hypothetical protein